MKIILDKHGLQRGQAVQVYDKAVEMDLNGVITAINHLECVVTTMYGTISIPLRKIDQYNLQLWTPRGIDEIPEEEVVFNAELKGKALNIYNECFIVSSVFDDELRLRNVEGGINSFSLDHVQSLLLDGEIHLLVKEVI